MILFLYIFLTSDLLIPSFLMSNVSSGRSPLMSAVSESLRSLTKNERRSKSLVFLANCSFANFFAKNEQFFQKTDEQITNPAFCIDPDPT